MMNGVSFKNVMCTYNIIMNFQELFFRIKRLKKVKKTIKKSVKTHFFLFEIILVLVEIVNLLVLRR